MSSRSLREKVEYDLDRLVKAISSIDSVVAVILFGSVAKGRFNEYSDYDLVVIFKDRESMLKDWRSLYEKIGRLKIFVQAIPKSLKDFWKKTEPTFLNEILKSGIVLYAKYPFKLRALNIKLDSHAIISYDMSGLDQKAKMRVIYRLYGKNGRVGLLRKLGGAKLSEGCVIVPREKSFQVLKLFEENGVKYKLKEVYASSIT